MTHLTRTTLNGICMAAMLATGGTASAASWQRTYLEPAIQAWMGVVTLLADDGEREGKKKDESKCEGECKKGKGCTTCDGKRDGKGHRDWRHHGPKPPHQGHGPHPMGPPHGPRGDVLSLLHDINARLARIERALGVGNHGGHPMHGMHHGTRHAKHLGMAGHRHATHEQMRAAREKWENASPEERAEMKKKREARMKEGRERGEKKEAAEASNPRMSKERRGEMENRVKRLEAELQRIRAALESSGS